MSNCNNEYSLEHILKRTHIQKLPSDVDELHQRYCKEINREQFLQLNVTSSRTAEQIAQLCQKPFFENIFNMCRHQRETNNFIQLKSCIPSDIVSDVLVQFINHTVDLPNIEKITLSVQAEGLNTDGLEQCMIDGKVQMFYPKSEQLQNKGNKPQLLIIGDTHGTIEVIEKIFTTYGYPGEDKSPIYAFNGDYVDRGSFGVEIFIILAMCKIAYPNRVYLTRGNHETKSTCSNYSFLAEVFIKYSAEGIFKELFQLFLNAFMTLPLAISIQHSILILHGGVNPGSIFITNGLNMVERRREPMQYDGIFASDPLNDFLWSDPSDDILEAAFNQQRQTGAYFGRNGASRVLNLLEHNVIVRSHTCCDNGFDRHHGGRTWTVFSVPNYADTNVGAVIEVQYIQNGSNNLLQCVFSQFMTSPSSAIDNQIFFNQSLISSYANLTQQELRQLSGDAEKLKMFFALFSMGYIDANIGSPKSLKCLVSKEGIKIPLPGTLMTQLGQTKLIDTVHDYLQQNQMDITELLSTYEWKEQSDAIMVNDMNQSLQEMQIDMPRGLFNSNIVQSDIIKIMEKASRAVAIELRRREKRKLQRELRLKRRQKKQQKAQKKGK